MIGAQQFIALLADPETFESWDEPVVDADPLGFVDTKPYPNRLAEARARTGVDESVLTGMAALAGQRVALVVSEFGFLGGSMGMVTGERVARALERASALSVPLVGVVASGGVRMQEGALAFLQMVKTADAARRFRQSGGGLVVYLAGPVTGGVLASWVSLAQVTLAAPGALVGLNGPRVIEATTGASSTARVQHAEELFAAGRIDELVASDKLRGRLAEILSFLSATAQQSPAPNAASGRLDGSSLTTSQSFSVQVERDSWVAVEHSRNPLRPGAAELLAAAGSVVCTLRGDGAGGTDDPGCLAGLCWFDGIPVVAVAQVRRDHTRAVLGPAGYRKARRAIALAAELKLPLLTVVDTCGAEVSIQAEHGGLAAEIARCLADLMAVPIPTLSVLLGEGSGGGALALLPADLVVAAEQAWLAPLAPEGSSTLLFHTTNRAAQLARLQRIAVPQLLAQGAVDMVVPERPDAAEQPESFLVTMAETVGRELRTLLVMPPEVRLERRWRRYRGVGVGQNSPTVTVPAFEGTPLSSVGDG